MLILYNPPSNPQHKPVLPMSLLALGALLEGEHNYAIVDGNIESDPLVTLDRTIPDPKSDVLAVTVMPGTQLDRAVTHCRSLKSAYPELRVVWGGYFPTQHYDACLRSDFVDLVVRGHGETTFKSLLDRLQRGEDPTEIPGLAYRDGEGGIRANDLPPIPHPDHMPDYPYHRVPMSRYVRRTFMGQRTLPHHSSYGCPFFCNFCAVVNMVDGRWLAQSAERTARVTRNLVRTFQADAVEFYDNNFFVQEARTAEFAERILDLGIAWWGESRIDTLLRYSDSTWQLMRRSGLRMVFLGAESGSDDTLRRMNKGGTATIDKTLAIAEKMASHGMVPEFSFVLGNPPDPEADIRQTIEFIRHLKRVNPHCEIILYLYTPVPLAGELYEEALQRGFKFPETLDEWLTPAWAEFSHRRSATVPWVEHPLRRKVWNFERVLNAYYPTVTDFKLRGVWRWLLKAVSAWRYHLRIYVLPLELRALQRVLAYQRPETSGF